MGIYIKDMKMPRSCSVCDFLEYAGGDYQPWVACRLTEETLEDPNSRGDECPLVEVKEPHGDLIDRDSLMRTLAENKEYFEHEGVNCCCYFRCPISDAVFALDKAIEALSTERTGKWIYCEDEDEECVDGYRCDQCGFFAPWDYEHKSPDFIEEYLYCPSCKARMKGGDSDD